MQQFNPRTFTHFSGFLLRAMFQFARLAQEIEQEGDPGREAESTSFVLGAIASSVAFLEALINEVFILAGDEHGHFYGKLDSVSRQAMASLWEEVAGKLSVLAKFDLVLALNGREVFDHGDTLYQDADALVQLRNTIIHYRMGWRPHPDPQPLKIEKRLKGRFPPSPHYKGRGGAFFPYQCLGAGCAAWAVKAARAYADEFHRRLNVVGYYQMVKGIPTLV